MRHLLSITALMVVMMPLRAQLDNLTPTEFQAKYRAYRNFPDSIRIEFPSEGAFVVIKEKNIQKNDSVFSEIPRLLGNILMDIQQGVADTEIAHRILVSYKPNGDRKMFIREQKNTSTEVLSRNNNIIQLIPPGWELEIATDQSLIHIYAPDFESLKALENQNFNLVQKTMNTELSEKLNRSSLSSRLVISNNDILSKKHERTGVHDILSFHIGAGFGVSGNQFHPFTKASLAISLRDRSNVYRHLIEFSASTAFYTFKNSEGSLYSKASNFLDLSYNFNVTNGNKQASWLGFGAGVLTTKKANFFKGKTARFFINKSFGEFELSPTLYLTNDYKDRLVGLGVSYTF